MKLSSKKAFTLIKLPVARKRGFTLIELLIVIAIILLTIAFGLPAFNKYGNNAEVSSTAEQIQATIEKAYSNSNTPPKGANEIHLWLMYGGTTGDVVNVRGYKQAIGAITGPGTNPGNVDFPANAIFLAEIVKIPDYMHLSYDTEGNGDSIFCNFSVASDVNCYNYNLPDDTLIPPYTPLGDYSSLILTSDKTDLQYRITISKKPFIVRSTKL